MKELLKELERRMIGAIDAFKDELVSLRTGRASLALLDGIVVDYYGTPSPLNQVAALTVPEPATIVIAPWEPKMLCQIERAILKSNLGITPTNDGKVVRLNIPPLTEERRKELAKQVQKEAEGAKIAIRNIRQDANKEIAKLVKDKAISEDEKKRGEDDIQKLTDANIKDVDKVVADKEKELLSV